MTFSFPALDDRLRLALAEDLGRGDATTLATIAPSAQGRAELLLKSPGVISGHVAAERVWTLLSPEMGVRWLAPEGQWLEAGARLGEIRGPLHALLAGERLALNLLQRLSGVASVTHAHVQAWPVAVSVCSTPARPIRCGATWTNRPCDMAAAPTTAAGWTTAS
ncbi:nicotinate-nucleotide diphosphorylase [Deinococcus radiophilus]|uniref:nicotinate-nucleotide diphosphorylase n=1 Tax=Deinococcus radiophilus TaxID=32062 RepID=UPI003616C93E